MHKPLSIGGRTFVLVYRVGFLAVEVDARRHLGAQTALRMVNERQLLLVPHYGP